MDKETLDSWFVRDVLALEGDLTRFLWRRMRREDDVSDLRQEVYARVYQAAGTQGRPQNVQAFVLTAARNLLIDRARRERIVSMDYVADLESMQPAVDILAADRQITARLELRRLQAALDTLPPRCRQVVRLRKIDQLPQREVAERMGIAEDTVERQLSKGIRLLADRLFNTGADDPSGADGVQTAKGSRREH
jgi:RNA polymerase sigma factor (sigma-70 family)